ncbi:TMEM143 family protein [Rhodospira trueperi]|nr:TMEM143 family protein [Rhodospira trueperi]
MTTEMKALSETEAPPKEGACRVACEDAPDTFIAVPQGALVERLADVWKGRVEDGAGFETLCRLFGLLFRIEGRETLAALRDEYHGFNPDLPTRATVWSEDRDHDYERLKDRLSRLLVQGNFCEIDADRLRLAETDMAEVDAEIRVPHHHYADVSFFARGRCHTTTTRSRFLGLMRRTRQSVRLRHVVVMIRFHDAIAEPRRRLPVPLMGPRTDARVFEGRVVIKLFIDVAEADLNMLYPGARAIMRLRDKLLLGVPALAGGVPVLMNILPALSVLFVVVAAYLGFVAGGSVPQEEMAKALAAVSALAGLGGFLMRQWIKFERQVLKYQMMLTDNLYYRNVCNNAAVFDFLLGTAEDQEFKEALLAYVHILRADQPLTPAGLKDAVEAWLSATFAIRVEFDIDDALDKLARLDLLERAADGTLRVAAPRDAEDRLRAVWTAVGA